MPSMTGAPFDVVARCCAVLAVLSPDEPHPQSATTARPTARARDTAVQASGTIGAMVADHAERHLFAELPELDAIPRRGLALTLAGVPRAGIASELGLSGAALSAVLAVSRKAVRRPRVELASGGRCERAERALSDRLDAAASELDKRFLDAHLA